MARANQTRANPAPGAGTIFALRAIGLVILARWLYSMSQMGYGASLSVMTSSPWACINVVFLFLLVVLPGAQPRAERPFHPLPQWLRQALRFFALLGFAFAIWSVGAFVWAAGWRRAVHAIAETNGWLVVAPGLYAAVMWICRPRALWRTNIAAKRFAIGRYAISLDAGTRTVVVWVESRKVGQYDARELSVKWPAAGVEHVVTPLGDVRAVETGLPGAAPVAVSARARAGAKRSRQRVELLWDSPAAAGHNRQTVFRVPLATDGDREAARALDATLRQVSPDIGPASLAQP
ncbi:hypothetical protein FAZ69_22485 [Trinickia terrae]|uniref:Uncharacterized protein n=1 Tax=Trinickia terrae TaxID=2571161 RepID=A0A4U1HTM2_9BURK|nr:hypothetical protein [Trinickia terrae]TKC83803.1 hypothetical protein FAZ69_22485 [Trinickia terrae]